MRKKTLDKRDIKFNPRGWQYACVYKWNIPYLYGQMAETAESSNIFFGM